VSGQESNPVKFYLHPNVIFNYYLFIYFRAANPDPLEAGYFVYKKTQLKHEKTLGTWTLLAKIMSFIYNSIKPITILEIFVNFLLIL
jgi:hypothetical protein